jgi:hypothetical protein
MIIDMADFVDRQVSISDEQFELGVAQIMAGL